MSLFGQSTIMSERLTRSSWHELLRLGAPYRGRFVLIALLAVLATAAELVEPFVVIIPIPSALLNVVINDSFLTFSLQPTFG